MSALLLLRSPAAWAGGSVGCAGMHRAEAVLPSAALGVDARSSPEQLNKPYRNGLAFSGSPT